MRSCGKTCAFSFLWVSICVFLPIVFVEGVAGQLFGDQALTVTFSLLISLLVALTVIPMLASRTFGDEKEGDTPVETPTGNRLSRGLSRLFFLFDSAVIDTIMKTSGNIRAVLATTRKL